MNAAALPSATPFSAIVEAPCCSLGIRCGLDGVREIRFLPPGHAQPPDSALARETVRQLEAWLLDARFSFNLPLAPRGTDFRRRVWQAIARIPPGRTRTYGDLARELSSSARAVGQACGDNPLPLIVPCHRVVGAKGGGGFAHSTGGWLIEVKRWLLGREGIS